MQKVLKDLYNGRLRPFEWHNSGPAYDELCAENLRRLQAFSRELDAEQTRTLNRIIDRQIEADAMEGEQRFIDGFLLGVRLMCEALGPSNR
ncbi:MAG: hypothetical protein HFE86_07575 [Clostridiales bacterium]|nr:hypothetical protein [Clostridiales bacterium]